MGLNRTRGDNYSSVRVTTSTVLDPRNDCYGVNATLGGQVTMTTPPAFSNRGGGLFSSTDDRYKIYDLGLNASTQPILIAAGAGMSFLGGGVTIAITVSGNGVQLTVLDDGVTIQVDQLSGGGSSGGGSALSQIPWYFDFGNVTGLASDLNSGADATHPLLTWNGGFIARVGKDGAGPWAVAPILHFMSTQPNPNADGISFIPTNLPFGIPGGSFAALILGTVTVKVAAGNILAAVTAKNRSAPANGQLLTLTFQGAAAGNVAALDFLQNTTGGKVSNSWARTNVGANQFTAFQPVTPMIAGSFPVINEFDTWAPGDTVQVSSIPKVYADALAGPIIVQNVEVFQVNAQGINFNAGTFQECRISGSIDPSRTRLATFQNCTLAFQGNRYVAPSLFLQAGGTSGTTGSTVNLGSGSVLTHDTYVCCTGGGPTYAKEVTIEAAYIDSGGLILVLGDTTLEAADPQVAGSPFMWGPGNVDLADNAELLINPGNAVASILNQGGLFGAVTFGGQGSALFLDSVANPAVFSGLRNVTAALLDTDGHGGVGFRNGVAGTVVCRSSLGSAGIRSGSL